MSDLKGAALFVARLKYLGVYELAASRFALKYGITSMEDLYGEGRTKSVTLARHELMYLLRLKFKWSFPEVGKFFGRDHTTVMAGINKVKTMIEEGIIDGEFFES